jgi:thiol-disulfide isomerase/thioredoxin
MSDADEAPPDQRRKAGSRYSLFVGLAFIVLIVVATANTLRTRDDGILGATAVGKGGPLPQFAVPDLADGPDNDANVFQDDCKTGSNPCPADDQRTPACQVDVPGVIRICDLFDKPLVISFWFTGGADCLPTQDIVDDVAARFADRVNFLSLNVRDDRDKAQEIVDSRGWQIPVGWDRDGAVSNLYRVGGCPTVAFAYPGGLLQDAQIGTDHLSQDQLTADVKRLIRESDRRAQGDR